MGTLSDQYLYKRLAALERLLTVQAILEANRTPWKSFVSEICTMQSVQIGFCQHLRINYGKWSSIDTNYFINSA